MLIIRRRNFENFIRSKADTQIFSVKFKYKDTVENRKLGRVNHVRPMTCRLGVSAYVKGVEKDRNATDKWHHVLTVYEMTGQDRKDEAYRRINLETIFWAKIGGIEYTIID